METGRRAFLLGQSPSRARTLPQPFRPPWAVVEAEFLDLCSRCGDCVAACPTGLLSPGSGHYPEADFLAGYCNFCADCAQACKPLALNPRRQERPWQLLAHMGEDCLPRQGVLCRSCEERCEVGAIRFSPRLGGPALPWVDSLQCNGCGACVADCPTRAIRLAPPSSSPLQGN